MSIQRTHSHFSWLSFCSLNTCSCASQPSWYWGAAAITASQAPQHLLWDKDLSLSKYHCGSMFSFLDKFYILIRWEWTPVRSLFANELCGTGSLPRALNNLFYEKKTSLDLTPLRAFIVCVVQEEEQMVVVKQATASAYLYLRLP